MDSTQTQSQSQGPSLVDPARPNSDSALWRGDYAPLPGVYDEMSAPDGSLRPHWKRFVDRMDQLGPNELTRRWDIARRLIHENGVTYNVYGDPQGMDRPWELDALPLMLSAPEWAGLEEALIQRAQLLNLIVGDLYGPQALLRAGLIPPELVYANPGFLRPCHGLKPPYGCYVHVYAADLARSPNGQWSVITDRTQAPSGAGYALENRIILSRVFPDLFKECRIQRLALFFQRLRETLAAVAPHNRENPRTVLLTPGPYNETYFEHAYLARYLNYTLVEGGDLTVRDQCVYLKTLGGLHRVDVILRRLDDDFCDPLELRPDSFLGIPGLLQAVRAGNVAIANTLGSSIVETPALKPFLPQLCRHLLNEDLRLPSVPSYWCGQPGMAEHVIAHLDKMVVKAAFPQRGFEPLFGSQLTAAQKQELAARIRSKPHNYVGQEQVALSTAPVFVGNQIQPSHTVLRGYLCAHGASYAVMPGGLTQIPSSADSLVFSLQRGGRSKDTWVQAAGPVSTFSLLRPAHAQIELTRGGSDLPSRIADNLFWLGRYVERTEGTVRLLRGLVNRLSEKSLLAEVRELPLLMRAFLYLRRGEVVKIGEGGTPADDLRLIVQECRAQGGLFDTLRLLYSVARVVRDRISADTWRVLSSLKEDVAWPERLHASGTSEVIEHLNVLLMSVASFGGLASESMTRGYFWRFMDMGRRIERAGYMCGLLRNTLIDAPGGDDAPMLEAVLDIADSSMTYRRRYMANLQFAPVLDILLADETNPRSVAYQLVAMDEHVNNLPRDKSLAHLAPEQRIVVSALSALRLCDISALCKATEKGKRDELAKMLTRMDEEVNALSTVLTRGFLSHAQTSRQLASFRSPTAIPGVTGNKGAAL